jgi:predicted nucleotide-binding protein
MPDTKKIFVIHGRNLDAVNALAYFLRSLGLIPIDIDQLAGEEGGTASLSQIVRAGLKQAHGIIALFTPDELAFLDPQLSGSHDSSTDLRRWQARPNVMFEAGMAFAIAPQRTILLTLSTEVSLFSDVGGMHILQLANSLEARNKLRKKLIGIGCDIDQTTDSWKLVETAGDFDTLARRLPEVSTRSPFRYLG